MSRTSDAIDEYERIRDGNAAMTKLEPTLTILRERAVILRQGRWSDGPEDAELMEHAADAIEGLASKNAWLQASRNVVVEDAKEIAARMCDARAKNAKLRDLCKRLYLFAMDEHPDSAELNFADELDELGIEVTE